MVGNAAIVRQNAHANRLPITVIPAAVTDVDGWASFEDRGSLLGRLEKTDTAAQAERRERRARKPAYSAKRSYPCPWSGSIAGLRRRVSRRRVLSSWTSRTPRLAHSTACHRRWRPSGPRC
jgi:hypothetical protein